MEKLMKNWEKYDETRLFKIIEENILVIKPKEEKEITPLFCEVCEFPMTNSDDFLSYKEYKCCNKCRIYLVSRNSTEWNNGWRPDKETMEKYIKYRKETFKPTFRFS
jgi:hypothetical protein